MTGPDCAVMCNLISIHTHKEDRHREREREREIERERERESFVDSIIGSLWEAQCVQHTMTRITE